MSVDSFDELEGRVVALLEALSQLKGENDLLREENRRLKEEKKGVRTRIDSILSKLEGV
ncbi:cell division protein ZapB [Geomesophilobacter sediminis]|uniref:Cell division protein ZapB n=1 Tax=Geomesophilobacter sediminis TaxID=2798584 RepID=A0A8J7IQ13_9BACT|nr:cell division protein ZapB [Geomesophilobacter sediminis]MBJ6725823.1 cell division protein ZapB [Geomesophilobacter sediminis]